MAAALRGVYLTAQAYAPPGAKPHRDMAVLYEKEFPAQCGVSFSKECSQKARRQAISLSPRFKFRSAIRRYAKGASSMWYLRKIRRPYLDRFSTSTTNFHIRWVDAMLNRSRGV